MTERGYPGSLSVLQRLRGLFGGGERDSLAQMLQDRDGEVVPLAAERRKMIERVIAFDSKLVTDVMAPRADIVGVDATVLLEELMNVFATGGHSRLPVYRGDLDDPIGMVHIKDLVEAWTKPDLNRKNTVASLVRKVIYVPPAMAVTDLLLTMQAERIHMALVIDEFGGTDGLVTIEDLVEEIVGEIHDEHDEEADAPRLIEIKPGVYEAGARLDIDQVEQLTGLSFAEEDEEIDTLGGLVFTLAGRVPHRGEIISHKAGIDFEILDADVRRVRKILIRLKNPPTPTKEA
ncbi:MAG: hemolysin family protein [Parvularculaceae bacterium]